ncbi:MAG: cupin domain-containing protein [Oscillospiraceae bacterium]|jgi:mannose-6-phosphate isomerase-like protein (cupin superfamily)|nr:cupin domain-containing protein [Oscillospiraceae bacterium]
MDDFPQFMKQPANIVPAVQQNTPETEGYFYTGLDGSQMAFWTCRADRSSAKHTHTFDEYLVCVGGKLTAYLNGEAHALSVGEELLIPAGTEHYEESAAGTRTIHAFGGRRIQ